MYPDTFVSLCAIPVVGLLEEGLVVSDRNLFHFGLRQKVILILLTALLITLTANSWLTLQSQERDFLKETDRWGTQLTRVVANNLVNNVVGYNYRGIELFLKELLNNEDIVYARVVSAKGNTMAQVGEAGNTDGVHVWHTDIKLDDEVVGNLSLGLSKTRITAKLRQARSASIYRQFLTIFLIMIVEFAALSYIIIRPISIFSQAIEQGRSNNRKPVPVPIHSKDEIGNMATRFNSLQAELNDARERLHSKIELANAELKQANERLQAQTVELTRVNQELEQMSVTDPLTGLYNRRFFEGLMDNEMQLSIRNNEINSIILIDIDNFKSLNDQFGHTIGDEILKTIAARLLTRVRKTDIACRFGGDEFFVLCRRADKESSLIIAEDIKQAVISSPLKFNGLSLMVTFSMGIATVPGDYPIHTAEEFLRCADIALYHCKQAGRNKILHYSTLTKDKQAYPSAIQSDRIV